VGLIVSVPGAYLAWTLMAAEVLFVAAEDHDMPAFLARENRQDVPVAALVMTSALITAVLAVTLFSDDAFTFTPELTSAFCSHTSRPSVSLRRTTTLTGRRCCASVASSPRHIARPPSPTNATTGRSG
jgi:hypothetical protein